MRILRTMSMTGLRIMEGLHGIRVLRWQHVVGPHSSLFDPYSSMCAFFEDPRDTFPCIHSHCAFELSMSCGLFERG